jgi:hypothetical protein
MWTSACAQERNAECKIAETRVERMDWKQDIRTRDAAPANESSCSCLRERFMVVGERRKFLAEQSGTKAETVEMAGVLRCCVENVEMAEGFGWKL